MPLDPYKIIFEFSDGTTHDASISEASNPKEICFKYGWSIMPESTIVGTAPTYSIEVSNNGVDWSAYDTQTENADIDQPFDDAHLDWTFVRINYTKTATTTGTVKFEMILKPC